jgi:hypothetical protein
MKLKKKRLTEKKKITKQSTIPINSVLQGGAQQNLLLRL